MTQVNRMSDSQSEKPSNKPDRWKSLANLLGLSVTEPPVAEPVLAESVLSLSLIHI